MKKCVLGSALKDYRGLDRVQSQNPSGAVGTRRERQLGARNADWEPGPINKQTPSDLCDAAVAEGISAPGFRRLMERVEAGGGW